MDDFGGYIRPQKALVPAEEPETNYLNDPYLVPMEGDYGYFKCTLCDATLPGEFHVRVDWYLDLYKQSV